jgi:hypothetical protein
MKTFQEFISETYFIVEKRGGNPKYSDEHANISLYNHLVSSPEVRELISKKDFDSVNQIIAQELETVKSDPKHPLNFKNASDEGFSGKKKTSEHEKVYYSEIERSVPGFLGMIQSKKGGNIAAKGWLGRVSGGEHEQSKTSWKGNVKGQGRFDYVFSDPEDPRKNHRVSGKDYRGSQAGSAQADQATATLERGVEVAAQKQLKTILANKPKKKSGETDQEYKERVSKYKVDSREKKKEIVSSSKETLDKIKELMASTKGMTPEGQKDVYTQVQAHIDGLEKTVPGVKRAAGQEMLQGKGQFSKGKTAQSMWTTGGEESSFRDPRQQSVSLRARAGKGKGREMAVAGDIQAAPKEKQAQKTRQSSFSLFSRQAQVAAQKQHAQTAAELEQQSASAETVLQAAQKDAADAMVVRGSNGKPVPRKNAFFLQNNPGEAERHNQNLAVANNAVTAAQSNLDAAVTAHRTHISTPPTSTKPASSAPQKTQQQAPQPSVPQPVKSPQASAPQPVATPEDEKEKRRKEMIQRMNAAGKERGLPAYA